MKKHLKILYLFSGKRTDVYKGKIHEDYPDTPFYGMNHLSNFDIDAEYKDIYDVIKSQKIVQKLPFIIKHILLTKFINKYDIVFGSSIMYNIIFKKLFRLKTKFVLFNISLSNTLFRNNKNKLKYRLLKYLINQIDLIVCLSKFQMDDLVTNYQIDSNKLTFIPLGVDKDFWAPIEFDNNKNILSVGKDNGRDYKTLFEAAKKLPHERFVVVCGRWNVEGLEIPSNVKMIYGLSINELKEEYQYAKMLLLITHSDEYSDGSDCSGQTVLLDAMSSALPIIVTRREYLNDYVSDNVNILQINPYDSNDIVAKIRMLDDKSLAKSLGESARSKVINNFSTLKMAENLSRDFKKLF